MQMRNARERAVENRQQFIILPAVATSWRGAATPIAAPDAQSIQLYQWPAGSAISSAIQIGNICELPFDIQFLTQNQYHPPALRPLPTDLGPGTSPWILTTSA